MTVPAMTTVADLVTDLADADVDILRLLCARLCFPSGPRELDRWPTRVTEFWRDLSGALEDERHRRARMVRELSDSTGEGGAGTLVTEDDEDLSGWIVDVDDTPDVSGAT